LIAGILAAVGFLTGSIAYLMLAKENRQ